MQSQKGFGSVEAIVILVVVAIIGALAWTYYNNNYNVVSDNKKTASVKALQPEDIIQKVKSKVEKTYTLIPNSTDGSDIRDEVAADTVLVSELGGAPGYHVEGYDFSVSYSGGRTLDMRAKTYDDGSEKLPSHYTADVRKDIATIYTEVGLKLEETRGDAEESTLLDVYTGKGLICTVEPVENQSDSSTASCGQLDSYAAVAKKVKSFAELMPDKTTKDTLFSEVSVKDSKTSGYQTAGIGVSSMNGFGGYFVEFYKKDTGDWEYFRSAQTMADCSEYNTVDIKSAFRGDACLDGDRQSTVE